jgi:phenylacetate-coenzyme A ligase PaaK-like adenylate-forming protein
MNDLLFSERAAIEATQQANFAEMAQLLATRHPYYKPWFESRGLKTLEDLPRLPVTRKEDFMREPERFVLESEGLAEEMRVVWDVMYTTGSTTGKPTPFVSTAFDFYRILELHRNMMRVRQVRPDDVIANLFPLTKHPHGAFIRVLHAAAAMNLRVVSALPGDPSAYFTLGRKTDEVVRIVERSRATILWGVPSYVRRVLARGEELGADFRSLRLAFVTGEGVPEAARDELTRALRRAGQPDAWVSISYGSTETQGGLVECAPGSGYHNPAPDQFYLEVVDPESLAPLPDGASGLVLLTHLQRRGTVLVRYALGDISTLTHERCPHCGSWTDRLVATPRRADKLLKIKGTLVNPALMVAAAEEVLVGREFQFVITKEDALSLDLLTLKVSGAEDSETTRKLADSVKAATGLLPKVQFVPEIPESAGAWKVKRVVDQRNSESK